MDGSREMQPIREMTLLKVAVGLGTTLLLMILYLVFFEPPWLVYSNLPFPVLNNPVRAGEAVELKVSRCSSDTHTRLYAISHKLVPSDGGDVTILRATESSIEPGCNTLKSSINVVPLDAKPGKYVVTGYGEIQGIIRSSSIAWRSEEFEVVK